MLFVREAERGGRNCSTAPGKLTLASDSTSVLILRADGREKEALGAKAAAEPAVARRKAVENFMVVVFLLLF